MFSFLLSFLLYSLRLGSQAVAQDSLKLLCSRDPSAPTSGVAGRSFLLFSEFEDSLDYERNPASKPAV